MVQVISVHIPKAAGSTFHSILDQVYAAGQVTYDYQDRPLDPASPFNRDPAAWQRAATQFAGELKPGTRVIHGHFSPVKYAERFPQAQWVVWLRDPLSRLISQYFYWRQTPPVAPHSLRQQVWEGRMTFQDLIEVPIMQNVMTQVYLRGMPLTAWSFMGIQEHFADDLPALRTVLGWPRVRIVPCNENRYPGYQERVRTLRSDQVVMSRMAHLNRDDLDLYRMALGLRAKRLANAASWYSSLVRRLAG